ncbi:GTP cyclohydrolase, FolE2/MptA family [Desulfogranum japonicum]|uniref:GTP cyclohydrolase, FolE2/MptA family n=1 Tax=Desulfogranum japonicum TaxID=231447 RepID=UPI00049208B9|nr:GTP cyclohydrolase, FolE2/MptA family [Desulfogranum japonicum]
MQDVQSSPDSRCIDIRKVGVKNISYPITLQDKAKQSQQTVASVNMYVHLPRHFKGTHMSRFIEILNCFHHKFDLLALHNILEEMRKRLEAEAAHLEISFPYFFAASLGNSECISRRYDCSMCGSLKEQLDLVVEVEVPVQLNTNARKNGVQAVSGLWGKVLVAVRLNHFVWLEDLIQHIERGSASGGSGGDSPEAMCKRIGQILSSLAAFSWFRVKVEHVERGFSSYAAIEGP